MDYRRMEKRINFKAIMSCLALNLIAAGGVLGGTYAATGNAAMAIFYTFVSWSVTLSISAGYWIWYLFRKVKAGKKAKRNMAYLLMIMLATALLLVWWVASYLQGLF